MNNMILFIYFNSYCGNIMYKINVYQTIALSNQE
jgi:hypothetical protein